ncbi:thioesterase II family protein [Nocardia sp. NPDC056100]|uniref:thioesterase II family protein n=1 Tax=Nocardia sp. NPDC056100 TaxID=3345712 RepID=UPI0035E13CB3
MSTEDAFARWTRRMRRAEPGRTALVCFPPGGGAAGGYRALANHIGSGTGVYAVQYPGRRDRLRDTLIPCLIELADEVTAAIEPLFGGELALFGHSMGATVAFETARRLEARGQKVTALFASGRTAPSEPVSDRLADTGDAALIAEMERLANDPASVAVLRTDPALAAAVLPAVRNDYLAIEKYGYTPGEPLRCPIIALTGELDPVVTPAQVERWSTHTTGWFEMHTFPGSHFYLDAQPAAIAQVINSCI